MNQNKKIYSAHPYRQGTPDIRG